VLGVPIGLYVSELTSWSGAFLFVAALSVLAAIGIAVLLPSVGAAPRVALRDRIEILRRPDILVVLLITVCANVGAFSVYTYLAPVFRGIGGPSTLQLLIFTFGVFAVLGSYLSGHGSDKWGAVPVLTVILMIFAANHLLLSFWQTSLATALIYMAIWGVTGWGTVPPQQHRLVQSAGTAAGIAISLNASALYLGIALGGFLGGLVVETWGADHLWLLAGSASTLALLLVPVSVVVERRAAQARVLKTAGQPAVP
jgi:predicted MFS family arabinose efflux permease